MYSHHLIYIQVINQQSTFLEVQSIEFFKYQISWNNVQINKFKFLHFQCLSTLQYAKQKIKTMQICSLLKTVLKI